MGRWVEEEAGAYDGVIAWRFPINPCNEMIVIKEVLDAFGLGIFKTMDGNHVHARGHSSITPPTRTVCTETAGQIEQRPNQVFMFI